MNTIFDTKRTFSTDNGKGAVQFPDFPGERLIALDGALIHAVSPAGAALFRPTAPLAMVILSAIRDVEWSLGPGVTQVFDAPAGTVLVFPAESQSMLRWPTDKESVSVTLSGERLEGLKEFSSELGEPPFSAASRNVDPKCLQVAHLLRGELQKQAPINERYLDALMTVVVTLLLRNHVDKRRDRKETGGLSYQASRRIEAYLRENFCNKISIAEMAAQVGISPGHFLTSFRESFGQTPHQYLLMLRLNEAEKQLRETDMPLSSIAEMMGFSSQSHMTTALKKNKFATPGEIRRRRLFASPMGHEVQAAE
ncbi:AraC family transcriptional regulator [Mesorhizobium sp. RMAD-H1]|uniref:AraC family transcriptional regulator n=1 Tax=Mesorhizobium sp. RMAD-H1 TaxID=2587065 RepID=UPI00161A8775|nr:AraC family transcriptional regulator [Mesorhizobium sp. RMAD-H1]MBB2969922.1 AraC family transcriptional regulator [Mesorhizobium sp. RMAD-H1]